MLGYSCITRTRPAVMALTTSNDTVKPHDTTLRLLLLSAATCLYLPTLIQVQVQIVPTATWYPLETPKEAGEQQAIMGF